jgi:hypothetical protein
MCKANSFVGFYCTNITKKWNLINHHESSLHFFSNTFVKQRLSGENVCRYFAITLLYSQKMFYKLNILEKLILHLRLKPGNLYSVHLSPQKDSTFYLGHN